MDADLPAVLPKGAVQRVVLRFGPLPRPLPDVQTGYMVNTCTETW